jgi:hypothetical protein
MLKLPTLSFNTLFHVGSMDITQKDTINYEGNNGLSVSTAPDAWRQINRGFTGGDTHSLTKKGNRFIDYHAINLPLYHQLQDWGVENGYLETCQKFKVNIYDSEADCVRSCEFFTEAEAKIEAEEHDADVFPIDTYCGSAKFAEFIGESNKENHTLIVVAYCAAETQLDGVYWRDRLDPSIYSSPRGVILQNKLTSWNIKKGL